MFNVYQMIIGDYRLLLCSLILSLQWGGISNRLTLASIIVAFYATQKSNLHHIDPCWNG